MPSYHLNQSEQQTLDSLTQHQNPPEQNLDSDHWNQEILYLERGKGGDSIGGKLKFEVEKPLLSGTQSGTNKDKDCSGGEEETTSSRPRKSRWDPPPGESNEVGGASSDGSCGTGTGRKKRKSRWADEEPKPVVQLPDFMKDFIAGIEFDPQVQALNSRLLEISRKLQSGLPLDDRPEGARSPSPEPIYDNMGIRINTREYRARERLNKERQEIISQIIKKNPEFKPPADYRPPKLQKKLYIPMKEYPGYNFIGLIIGPRGNTQKRMAKETGAKIVIRGKGSAKEGRIQQKKDLKFDPSENEDLHVLVEAETQEALDAAAGMVEKLLQPIDEVLNEHKRQQLRELAALNGTIKDEEYCRLCGELGHRQFACPSRTSNFKSDVLCKICGDGGHPTIDCPVKATTGKKMDEEYQNFLAELGGTAPESAIKPNTGTLTLGSDSTGSGLPWASGNNAGGASQAALGSNAAKPKEYDDTNLYIGYLPPTLDDDGLIQLFSSFGEIVMTKVIKDRVSGLSKGYGFVKYSNVQQANNAIANMNGHRVDGRTIAVRVAGKPPQPAVPPAPTVTAYTPPNQGFGSYMPQQSAPIGSIPLGSYAGAPVPWGPPAPSPYAPYAPPPPGSATCPLVRGQPWPPYGVNYPPAPASSVFPSQTVSSGEAQQTCLSSGQTQQSYAPGVISQPSTPLHSIPTYVYDSSVAAVQASGQLSYPTSYGYHSDYGVAPSAPPPVSQSAADHSINMNNVLWASNPPVHPSAPAGDKTACGADEEYEKFMADMK